MPSPARLTGTVLDISAFSIRRSPAATMTVTRTTGHASIHGIRIDYEVYGRSDDGAPLLLLHGGGSTIDSTKRTRS